MYDSFLYYMYILDAAFVITNSKIALNPIIYCSADFCDLFSFTKSQLLLKSSSLSFLYGEKTSTESIQALAEGLVCDREVKVQLSLYTRKGSSPWSIFIFIYFR